jgi:SAM-dependent methyltransferase
MDLSEAKDLPPAHRHPWEIARLWVMRRLIQADVQLGAGDAVIDIGCGDAFVLAHLARAFPAARFFGVDSALSDEAIQQRQSGLPPNVHLYRDLDALPPLDRPAALILLMDVIEHIEDDHGFLVGLRARPLVGAQTRFLVTVPAYQSLFGAHDVFLRHFRRYSNGQLRECLERAGLRVLEIGYFFSSLLPLRVLQVLKEHAGRTVEATGTGLSEYRGGPVMTTVISRVLIADAFTTLALQKLGIRVPGLSNFALCRTSV